jgi:hypothetical protein
MKREDVLTTLKKNELELQSYGVERLAILDLLHVMREDPIAI